MTEMVGFIAASPDGRTADASDGLGWLGAFADGDHGCEAFFAGVGPSRAGRVWVVGGGWRLAGPRAARALDVRRLFTTPVVLGAGPLLPPEKPLRAARLVTSRTWTSGAVETEWAFAPRAA